MTARLSNNTHLEQHLAELRARDVGIYGAMLWQAEDVHSIRASIGMPTVSDRDADALLHNIEQELNEVQSRAGLRCLESYIDQADLYKKEQL
jgi:hypothetical protein